jgi:hypothetical protein
MEQYLDKLAALAGFIVVVFGFIYKHWASFEVVYKSAKTAYWVVEEIAVKKGLVSEEKAELFEEKFKSLMKAAGKYVTKENIKLAHDLALKFCSKYRAAKKNPDPEASKKQHIITEDEAIILIPKEAVNA